MMFAVVVDDGMNKMRGSRKARELLVLVLLKIMIMMITLMAVVEVNVSICYSL